MKIDHAEIKKRLMVFALSLIIIHRIILLAAKGTSLTSRTCVETDDNVYFCTDDLEEARQKAKKTHRYYLNNYGVKQTIMGNTQDVATMRRLESEMGPYLKKIIEEHGGGEEWLKEQCTNQHKNCIFWAMKGECTSNPVRPLFLFVGCVLFESMRLDFTLMHSLLYSSFNIYIRNIWKSTVH